MNHEFDELVFSYMNLDLEQKRSILLTLLSDNIEIILNRLKNKNINIKAIETDIVNDLDINDDNDFLTFLYILVRQLEHFNANYIVSKDNK